ncbi:MAG: hypothetical protein WCG50_05310 [Rhodoferax sp.]
MKIQTLMTALVLAASGAAFAQTTPAPAPAVPAVQTTRNATATPGLDQRQANQEKRIEQGVASGQLNKKETMRLEKREAKLQADKLLAKADGKVTPQERKKLQREANRDSKAIYKQKHDKQVAAPAK